MHLKMLEYGMKNRESKSVLRRILAKICIKLALKEADKIEKKAKECKR